MNGTIHVRSDDRLGTTFLVRLPAAASHDARRRAY
jgi:signal transduction histidine kinase